MKTEDRIIVLEQDLDHAKNVVEKFIKSCSHELKSPITSIEGLVRIAEYYTDHAEVKQCLAMIKGCVANMKSAVHTLQEYTTQLQREFKYDNINALQLVERVVQESAADITREQVNIEVNVAQYFPWRSDREHHYWVLKNLVSNAIQFSDPTKAAKHVGINVKVDQHSVELEVSDNGIGIHEAETNNIFYPFHRSSPRATGNGLGLFMVQALARKLNAKISLWTKENEGTTVKLSIPNLQRL